ncbi:MAG: hypothetical protein J6V66_06830 [Clostridia bacterium]|nr:hypothetical protein [Clostridia bacterium]
MVGKNNLSNIKKQGYYEIEFTDMKYAYAVADLCVSRAGSNTIFELLYLKIPTLLIPLPKAESRGDQIENAEYFFSCGLAHMLMQKDIDFEFLTAVDNLYANSKVIIGNMDKRSTLLANDKIISILTSV